MMHSTAQLREARSSLAELFLIFLRLGLTSFGGPMAHLAYFRDAFVARRKWLSEGDYAGIVALAQFLPGPASSQTGFAVGVLRGGLPGGLAAFAGFTLPSGLIMLAAAFGLVALGPQTAPLVHGLKLVAVAVVAHAVLTMGRTLAPDWPRRGIALAALLVLLALRNPLAQLLVIAGGALAGVVLLRLGHSPGAVGRQGAAKTEPLSAGVSQRAMLVALALVIALVAAAQLAAHAPQPWVATVGGLLRAGALTFGGGHVILPLTEQIVVPPGWIARGDFLAAYGLAQALPGPINAFGAFVGAAVPSDAPLLVGLACLLAAFAPGLLLIYAVLPVYRTALARPQVVAAVAGANAAVVGLLAAALANPILPAGVGSPLDAAIAAAGLALLWWRRLPVLAVVAAITLAGAATTV